jgi:transcriptional regulator with XRE-family HTH domain
MVSNWLRGRRRPDPESIDRIADVLNADVTMLMQLAGHLPATEPIDPDDPVERIAGKVRRLRSRPLWVKAIENQADFFLEELRLERKAARQTGGEG